MARMNLIKKLSLIIAAAAVTFGVIVVSIIVYQYTAMEPTLPTNGDCQLVQFTQTEENTAEIRHYQCQRGQQQQWKGQEVWLYQAIDESWQRMLTTKSAECLVLELDNHSLHIQHDGRRIEMNLAEPVFLYNDRQGQKVSLAVDIARQPLTDCRVTN